MSAKPQKNAGTNEDRVPVSGSCSRCGCALGFAASRQDDAWFCCGACAGSDRCGCGCKPAYARDTGSDQYIPTRRMFASRHPDELQTDEEFKGEGRAFPFSDRVRGR